MIAIRGRIKAISISNRKGIQKTNVPEATLKDDFGIVGDAHAGPWHRQVSLLAMESIDEMLEKGAAVSPGDFAENVTTEGVDLRRAGVGDQIRLGKKVELVITQLGKKCHRHCEVFDRVGDCVMPREGIFAKVTQGGSINVGDAIEIFNDKIGRV